MPRNFVFILTLLIFLSTIGMTGFLLIRQTSFKQEPKNRSFWKSFAMIPVYGVAILFLIRILGWDDISDALIGTEFLQPYSIIILFFSLTYICISIDLTGFFEYIALLALQKAGRSPKKLFMIIYFLSAGLTIFTSNDIVILTLTPIIIYLSQHAKLNPIPFLIAQFYAANTWSILLYVGNPTNIIVAEAYGLSFLEFTRWSFFPVLVMGFVSFGLLWYYFRSQFQVQIELPEIDPKKAIKDLLQAIFGVLTLLLCLISLSVASLFDWELWKICLIFALIMGFFSFGRVLFQKQTLSNFGLGVKRMPWQILPFIVGMFILVEALVQAGIITFLADLFQKMAVNLWIIVLVILFFSVVVCNLMNNQPMTILFIRIFFDSHFLLEGTLKFGAMFALIIGSNIGANFTLIGALAGIMWHEILNEKGIVLSNFDFAKTGMKIMPWVVVFGGLSLILVLI